MHTVYLSLGTNLGCRTENLRATERLISERVGRILRRSAYHETEPWGFESRHPFLNAALCVETPLSPHDLLHTTQTIERDMGRTKKTANREYHDRIIDIDILLYDNLRLHTPELTIPHPLMRERDFVMTPLIEILQ